MQTSSQIRPELDSREIVVNRIAVRIRIDPIGVDAASYWMPPYRGGGQAYHVRHDVLFRDK
jgi:hypothetical protein